MDEITIYIYILKEDVKSGVYGYTVLKEYAKLFESQRNMKLFIRKREKIDKYQLMMFMNNKKVKQICKDYLFDGKQDIEIMATIEESEKLSESCYYINNEIEAIVKELKQYPLKDKYLKVINELTKSLTKKDSDRFLNIDTFRLFYHLFKNTFYEDINDEEIYY